MVLPFFLSSLSPFCNEGRHVYPGRNHPHCVTCLLHMGWGSCSVCTSPSLASPSLALAPYACTRWVSFQCRVGFHAVGLGVERVAVQPHGHQGVIHPCLETCQVFHVGDGANRRRLPRNAMRLLLGHVGRQCDGLVVLRADAFMEPPSSLSWNKCSSKVLRMSPICTGLRRISNQAVTSLKSSPNLCKYTCGQHQAEAMYSYYAFHP